MKKYLWSVAPLVVGGLIALLLHLRGAEMSGEREMSPEVVARFMNLFLIAGGAMTVVWLFGCVLHDIHQWFVRRPIRRMLREDEEREKGNRSRE